MPIQVSVIIPVYNEEKDIGYCLTSLSRQTFKNFEVIVVDDGSTDNTQEVVKEYKNAKLLLGQHKGPGFSRNIGARKARGKILVFVDADMTFDKDYLKNLISPILKDKNIIGTTHDYEIVENTDNIWSRCWGKVRVSKEEAKDVKIFRAIKKDKFLQMGGFDPKYGYADDQTFWFKYKIKPEAAKDTTCYHKNPETLKAVYKQSRWIGASIDNWMTNSYIKFLTPVFMIILSPLAIPLITLKKVIKRNEPELFFPMLVFMTARYFGTLSGIGRKVYFGKNFR